MKYIVITGTSRGMGYEMVKLFAEKGHKVLALSRNDKPVSELNLEGVTAISCDISKPEDLDKVESEREIELDQDDDYTRYLLDAIRYVAGDSNNDNNG